MSLCLGPLWACLQNFTVVNVAFFWLYIKILNARIKSSLRKNVLDKIYWKFAGIYLPVNTSHLDVLFVFSHVNVIIESFYMVSIENKRQKKSISKNKLNNEYFSKI